MSGRGPDLRNCISMDSSMFARLSTIMLVVGLVVSVALLALSAWSITVFKTDGDWYACTARWTLQFGRDPTPPGPPAIPMFDRGWFFYSDGFNAPFRWLPEVAGNRKGHWCLLIPLWMPTLGFAVGLLALSPLRRRRRRKRGLCAKCGYDLRGSKDRCPECGTQFGSSRV